MRTTLALLCAALLGLTACTGRVRPGIGFSNDGTRVGMDLGEYDTAVAHPVTGEAPSEACPGGVCGVPDPVVRVRKSQVDAARAAASSPVPGLIVAGAIVAFLGILGWVVISARKVK